MLKCHINLGRGSTEGLVASSKAVLQMNESGYNKLPLKIAKLREMRAPTINALTHGHKGYNRIINSKTKMAFHNHPNIKKLLPIK